MTLTFSNRFSFCTIMEKYGALKPSTGTFDWESFLQCRSIAADDLAELVTCISFWFDGRSLVRVDSCHPDLPCFGCADKECNGFSLSFKKLDQTFMIVDNPLKSRFRHSATCHSTFSFREKEHKKHQLLRNAPHLHEFFKTCSGGPDLVHTLTLINANSMLEKRGINTKMKKSLFSDLSKHFHS